MRPATYLNPFTDFGFKKLFGEEYNKDLLIDFLNQLLKNEQGRIKTLTYLKNEHLGRSEAERRAVYDLYCENERGEKFIVEIQKSKQKFFKDRVLYYSTFPIVEQGKAGDWDFELKAVYTVAILDFVFDEDRYDAEKYRYDIKLADIETNRVFYDKLTFVYLEMPKFDKTLEQLETRFDKWLYILKHLERLHEIPENLRDRVFKKLFAAAEIAKFSHEEAMAYEDSLKVYRDLKNSFDTAREEGFEKGREEGIAQVAMNFLKMGQPIEVVSKATGLSPEALERLLASDSNAVKEPAIPYRPGSRRSKANKATNNKAKPVPQK